MKKKPPDSKRDGTRPISPCIKCGEFKLGTLTEIVITNQGKKTICKSCAKDALTTAANIILTTKMLE